MPAAAGIKLQQEKHLQRNKIVSVENNIKGSHPQLLYQPHCKCSKGNTYRAQTHAAARSTKAKGTPETVMHVDNMECNAAPCTGLSWIKWTKLPILCQQKIIVSKTNLPRIFSNCHVANRSIARTRRSWPSNEGWQTGTCRMLVPRGTELRL